MLRGGARIQRYNAITTKNYIAPVKPTGQSVSIDFLIIGGGGGGGGFVSYPNYYQEAGGGGAGGYISGSGIIDIGYLYTITVGGGGPGGSNTDNGTNGYSSSITGITLTTSSALGGGGGGSGYVSSGLSGASGGGGGRVATTGASGALGTPGQGNAGADSPGFALGGGGGGAGAAATNQNGGAGLAFTITGSAITYAGGGGGGATNPQGSFGVGGAGGGGNGGDNDSGVNGKSGTANTGGGGGGAGGFGGVVGTGGTGGSGVAIISYTSSFTIFTGGQITQYTQIIPITSASLLFNGTSSYLTTGADSLTSENFVMECFFYLNSELTYLNGSGDYQATIMAGTVQNGFWFNLLGSTSTPTTIYIDQMASGTGPSAVASNLNISIGVWHHVAIGRSGTSFSIWFNGISQTITTSRITGNYSAGTITVGYNANSASYRGWFPGLISNLRIVKGNTLPYTVGAGSITVSKEPLTAVTGTYLLLNTTAALPFKDSSTNNFTVTPTNVTSTNIQPNFYYSYDKVVHKFTSTGLLSGSIPIEYLVVAGGGSGGGWGSPWDTGGAGAGGLLSGGTNFTPGNLYTIVVGAGATGGAQRDVNGLNGANSSVSGGGISLTSYGGGYGALWSPAGSGGSGGGVSGSTQFGSAAIPGKGVYPGSTYIDGPRQGYDGATGSGDIGSTGGYGGGGGGAGGPPSDRTGGIGITSSITGSSITYAIGGYGGGGASGQANTGNGGAGGTWVPNIAGGSGGSGIVVLRYASTYSDPISTSGSPTITNTGGYKTFVWTSTGSIQF